MKGFMWHSIIFLVLLILCRLLEAYTDGTYQEWMVTYILWLVLLNRSNIHDIAKTMRGR